jgi:hypothetical protein
MNTKQRLKYEMFVRVRNFGASNHDLFPETSPAGQRFAQLTAAVASIENQLVRREQARTEARRMNATRREAAHAYMKAIASTGRQAADGETGPHPFRMPDRRATTAVLTTPRLFLEQAEQRQDQFVDLGMPPTFLTDFGAVVHSLEDAFAIQQDSRGARHKAQAGLEVGLARAAKLVAQLEVTVNNALRTAPVLLGQWQGARRVDRRSATPSVTPPAVANDTHPPAPNLPVPADVAPAATPASQPLKIAS